MKLIELGLVFMVMLFTITTLGGCSSEKTTNPSNGLNSSAVASPEPSKENNQAAPSATVKPPTSAQATPSPTVKPSTSAQPSSSSGEKVSSKITEDQAVKLVLKTIFNNNEGIVMNAFNVVESYNGFQCYRVKASSKAMQANGGSGTIGIYNVEIESGRIWDLSTNKLATSN